MLGAHSSFEEHRDESEAPSATVAGGGSDGELFAAEKIFRLEDGFDPNVSGVDFFFKFHLIQPFSLFRFAFYLPLGEV